MCAPVTAVKQIYAVGCRRRGVQLRSTYTLEMAADSSFQFRSCGPEVCPHASFMWLLRLHRFAGRQVGEWASAYPSVIRGSMAARSHNYAATMHISLPVAAKQGLETYRERHKTCFFTPRRRVFAAIRPYRYKASVWIAS